MEDLKGCKVKDISKVHDYYQIYTDRCIISIYNLFTIDLNNKKIEYMKIDDFIKNNINVIKNCYIKEYIIKENDKFTIVLSSGVSINVLIDNHSYTGAESVSLNFNNDKFIIIN